MSVTRPSIHWCRPTHVSRGDITGTLGRLTSSPLVHSPVTQPPTSRRCSASAPLAEVASTPVVWGRRHAPYAGISNLALFLMSSPWLRLMEVGRLPSVCPLRDHRRRAGDRLAQPLAGVATTPVGWDDDATSTASHSPDPPPRARGRPCGRHHEPWSDC
jgi:hypothetical protein